MLDIKSVEMKNFLSYGDKWTKVEFKNGFNLVTGWDNQKKRSNGAGKTSFMEAIIFSLFGQVSKGLKQSQIINWKNKKKCETKLTFIKNDHTYEFNRGLKPNFLKVLKDGNKYPINSSIKDFQIECENQIIGMSFKTFNSIIYLNPNNSISLLDTPKAQKRAFIEKQFNLTEFSLLNKLNNEAIRESEKKITVINEREKLKLQQSEDIEKEIKDIKQNIKEYKGELTILESQLKEYINKEKEIIVDGNSLIDLKEQIEEFKLTINDNNKELTKLNKKKNELKQKLIEIVTKIQGLKKQKDKIGDVSGYIKEQKKIQQKFKLYENVENIIKTKKESKKALRKQKDLLISNLSEHSELIASFNSELKGLQLGIKSGETKCPTCLQDVDYDTIKAEVDEKIESINKHKKAELETREIISNSINEIEQSIINAQSSIDDQEKRLVKKNNLSRQLVELKAKIEKVNEVKEIDNEIKELSKELIKKEQLKEYTESIDFIEKIIDKTNIKMENVYNDIELNEQKLKQKEKIKTDIKLIKEKIKSTKKFIKKYTNEFTSKENKVKENKQEIIKCKEEINKLVSDLDHFKYVKDILKDENIKQFAISHMIPIIERKANYYLGEAGFGFYLKLDAWIDAEIKGPGISDCSFASMSGGERKSIDLALKFAIMDISVARNPNFPNILILDELLDSSVDAVGIKQLIEVVKVKQAKHNLKVFIISHRSELGDLEPDNTYKVIKDDGFSTIRSE